MFPTQKAFPLRALECMHLLQQCQHGKSTSTTTNWHPRVPINEKAKPSRGATTIPHKLHVHRKNGKGFCLQVPPTTSIANITAHVLPSRDGKKLDVDHPTNDPRPIFRQTRQPARFPHHLSHEWKTSTVKHDNNKPRTNQPCKWD
jgi:hypothetical protein